MGYRCGFGVEEVLVEWRQVHLEDLCDQLRVHHVLLVVGLVGALDGSPQDLDELACRVRVVALT